MSKEVYASLISCLQKENFCKQTDYSILIQKDRYILADLLAQLIRKYSKSKGASFNDGDGCFGVVGGSTAEIFLKNEKQLLLSGMSMLSNSGKMYILEMYLEDDLKRISTRSKVPQQLKRSLSLNI